MGNHRAGRKITSSHTTLIDAACPLVDCARARPEVTRIILGVIKAGLRSPSNGTRVKIGFGESGCVLLKIRGNTSYQEVFVYTGHPHNTKFAIAKKALDSGLKIGFEPNPIKAKRVGCGRS